MRANEILTEATKELRQFEPARISDPFQYTDWTFYELPKGKYTELPITIGFAIIKDKPVIWQVTGYSGKRWGSAYTGDEQSIGNVMKGLRRVNATVEDAKMAWLAGGWDRARANTREKMLPTMIAQSKLISPQFKKAPARLYRGVKITTEQMNALKAGKRIPMGKTNGSSWTFRQETAIGFTVGGGVVVEKVFTSDEVIVNLQSLIAFFHVPTDRFMSEDEILIHGNGIGPYLDPKTEKLNGYNFTAKDWGDGDVQSFKI